MLFDFNDTKSRKQVALAIRSQTDTKQLNAIRLVEYNQKLARLAEGTRYLDTTKWELPDA